MLKRGRAAKVVAITSGYGFVSGNSGGFPYYYSASKAALNMFIRSLAGDLKPFGIAVAILNPGWVRTDMGGAGAPVSPEQSVAGMMQVIEKLSLDQTGEAFNWRGERQGW
jgi:NAD(P)-dependent dehydrogenase (short-subunit alcohol dehydrogenase family)